MTKYFYMMLYSYIHTVVLCLLWLYLSESSHPTQDSNDLAQLNANADQVTTAPMVTAVAVWVKTEPILLVRFRGEGASSSRCAAASSKTSGLVQVPSATTTTSLSWLTKSTGPSTLAISKGCCCWIFSLSSTSSFSSVSSRFRFNDKRTGVWEIVETLFNQNLRYISAYLTDLRSLSLCFGNISHCGLSHSLDSFELSSHLCFTRLAE